MRKIDQQSSTQPTLFCILGPNGAGKTTFYQQVLQPRLGIPFVNADAIQKNELTPEVEAAYEAAIIAAERRHLLIQARRSFITESTFSHSSKIDLLIQARNAAFFIIIFHIDINSPRLAVARVTERVKTGGHPVPADKIEQRYERNKSLIKQAVLMADRGYVYDNSGLHTHPKLLARYQQGQRVFQAKQLPAWFTQLYKPVNQ